MSERLPRRTVLRRLHRLTAKLQGAMSVADVESTYLHTVPALSLARAHGLYRLEPGTERVLGVASDADASFLEEYERDGRRDDPLFTFVRERLMPVDSSRMLQPEVWEQSAAKRVLRSAGLHHSLEAPVTVAGLVYGTVNFARNANDPPFNVTDLRIARHIGEQIGLAMERASRFEEARSRADMLEETINQMPHAVVVTDLDANVLFTNKAALRMSDRNHKTSIALVGEEIARMVGALRDDNRRVATGLVKDPDSGQRLIVRSTLLGKPQLSLTLIQPCRDDDEFEMPVWDVLSPREQEIARLVAHGLTTKQIAKQAFISENTVKMHLKRIFAKTDIRNRAELVQRIWSDGKIDHGQAIP